jgi:hypothetical protein
MLLAKRWSKPALAEARKMRVGSVSVSASVSVIVLAAATDVEGGTGDGDDDELGVVLDEDSCAGESALSMAMETRPDDKPIRKSAAIIRHPSDCTCEGGPAFQNRLFYFLAFTYDTCLFLGMQVIIYTEQVKPLA